MKKILMTVLFSFCIDVSTFGLTTDQIIDLFKVYYPATDEIFIAIIKEELQPFVNEKSKNNEIANWLYSTKNKLIQNIRDHIQKNFLDKNMDIDIIHLKKILEQIPPNTKKYKKIHTTTCPICREPLCKKIMLSCKHSFCTFCLYTWYIEGLNGKNLSCPMCRQEATTGDVEKLQKLPPYKADQEAADFKLATKLQAEEYERRNDAINESDDDSSSNSTDSDSNEEHQEVRCSIL